MSERRGYTDEDLAAVSDNPEWTAEDFASAKPFHVIFPELAATLDQSELGSVDMGGSAVQVPIDRDLVDVFKAEGPDWEVRLNRKLRQAVDAS